MAKGSLGSNIVLSTANVLAVVGASLLAVPLLIDRLGIAGYGVWTLAQALVIYVTSAELGLGPALARFASVRRADPAGVRQILVGALLTYAAVGAVLVVTFDAAARPLVDLFDVPADILEDAVATIRVMGWVSVLALLSGALGQVLSGLERFAIFTVTNAIGSAVFLVALALGLSRGAELQDPAQAAFLQWGVVTTLRAAALRDLARPRGAWLPERRLVGDLLRYSASLQVASLSTLMNTQTDRIVVGLVASARTLGQVSIAVQVAEAARFLAYAAFTPMAARMAVRFGEGGEAALADELERVRRLWVLGVLGVIVVAAGLTRTTVEAWIGPGHDEAAAYAVVLLTAYGIGLLPSPAFASLRADGRPGLEGRFGLLTVAVNLVGTVALGVLFAAPGVVAATAAAYLASTAWVSHKLRRLIPPAADRTFSPRVLAAMVLAGSGAYAMSEAVSTVLPRLATLLAIGPVAAVSFGVFVLAALGVGPVAAVASGRVSS